MEIYKVIYKNKQQQQTNKQIQQQQKKESQSKSLHIVIMHTYSWRGVPMATLGSSQETLALVSLPSLSHWSLLGQMHSCNTHTHTRILILLATPSFPSQLIGKKWSGDTHSTL